MALGGGKIHRRNSEKAGRLNLHRRLTMACCSPRMRTAALELKPGCAASLISRAREAQAKRSASCQVRHFAASESMDVPCRAVMRRHGPFLPKADAECWTAPRSAAIAETEGHSFPDA